jgi:hypothetical protein
MNSIFNEIKEVETGAADKADNVLKNAPHTLPVRRPNDVLAARKPILSYRDQLREKVLLAEATA